MQANVGDAIVVDSVEVGAPPRRGEILEVIRNDAGEHYRVRWDEARLLTRMALLDQAQDAVDGAFKDFLEMRGGKAHETWRQQFDAWVQENVKEAE